MIFEIPFFQLNFKKSDFLSNSLIPLWSSKQSSAPMFEKCFEISKESNFVIPNNGVIGIDSSKTKWALVGALHM